MKEGKRSDTKERKDNEIVGTRHAVSEWIKSHKD